MRARDWWKGWPASLALFFRQRLSLIGEIIAQELERSDFGATGAAGHSQARHWRSAIKFFRPTSHDGKLDK